MKDVETAMTQPYSRSSLVGKLGYSRYNRPVFLSSIPRIYELGGKLPRNMNDFHDISACPPAYLPDDPIDIQAMLNMDRAVDVQRSRGAEL